MQVTRQNMQWLAILIGIIIGGSATAAPDRYVSLAGSNQWPFTNWAMATTNLRLAVNTANSNNAGDIVWISTGAYRITATIIVSNTHVRGSSGNPDEVLVDGQGVYRCFYLRHTNSLLADLTVTNGNAKVSDNSDGGGIYASVDGTSVISNCVVVNCTAARYGGGIFSAVGGSSFLTVLHSRIANNLATNSGGGINPSGFLIRDCTISQNTSESSGGLAVSVGNLINCIITGNVVTGSGGGIRSTGSTVVSNCVVIANSAARGGGIEFYRPTVARQIKLYNCLITGNTGSICGGGIAYTANTEGANFGTYYNCTIVANSSPDKGGIGIYNTSVGYLFAMFNTIIYSNVTGNYALNTNYMTNCCSTGLSENNNITSYPEFVDPVNGDYRLQNGSPCLNAGINIEGMAEAFDLDGRPRLDRFSRKVDMGAYEFVPEGMLFMSK